MIEDEMVGWHQQFNEHEFEQTPRDSEGTRKPGVLQVPEVKVTQSCPTLCEPMDYTVQAILQARILEWGAYPFPSGSSQPRNQTGVSCMVGGFFTNCATKEAQSMGSPLTTWFPRPVSSPVTTSLYNRLTGSS